MATKKTTKKKTARKIVRRVVRTAEAVEPRKINKTKLFALIMAALLILGLGYMMAGGAPVREVRQKIADTIAPVSDKQEAIPFKSGPSKTSSTNKEAKHTLFENVRPKPTWSQSIMDNAKPILIVCAFILYTLYANKDKLSSIDWDLGKRLWLFKSADEIDQNETGRQQKDTSEAMSGSAVPSKTDQMYTSVMSSSLLNGGTAADIEEDV